MTKNVYAWLGWGVIVLSLVTPACGGSEKDAKGASTEKVERVEDINETIAAFKKKDPSMDELFSKSAGYVVMPTVGEGAFIIGGGHGAGEAYEGGAYVGRVTINEVSFGAQIGGQSYSQLVFFEKPADFKKLKDGQFQFGAEVNAVAADAGAGKNAAFKDGVATFILPKKGLMAAAAVGGQKLDFTAAH
ncbi:MAG TPA: YSC84-related protein [Polyangiaceae bacterium]|nr:YSC84-related protein [Polyangiaceae bacterium]